MGFRNGAYATVWTVEPVSDTMTKARISISRKNKQTGAYDVEFQDFVRFVGTAAAKKAAQLKEKDRIKLGDTDVTNNYVKEKNVTYTNYKVFSFELEESQKKQTDNAEPQPTEGDEAEDERLPF